jgi:general secretion pathway protein H
VAITTRSHRLAHCTGFTLLELMLVIFLVGIIAALAMPNVEVQDDFEVLQRSARELLAAMELQEEESILTGTQRGLRLESGNLDADGEIAYQWLVWSADKRQWTVAEDLMRQYDGVIAGAAEYTLTIDGQPVVPQEPATGSKAVELPVPQIVIYASGDITDFELVLRGIDASNFVTLKGSYEGLELDDDREGESPD